MKKFKKLLAFVLAASMVIPTAPTTSVKAFDGWPFGNVTQGLPEATATDDGVGLGGWNGQVATDGLDAKVNNLTGDELFLAPFTIANFKNDSELAGNGIAGTAQNWNQFASLNKAIQQYHISKNASNESNRADVNQWLKDTYNSYFKYPLYFGESNGYEMDLEKTLEDEHNPYIAEDTQWNKKAFYNFLNHNLSTFGFEGYRTVIQGLVNSQLDANGMLRSRDGALMPYFDFKNWASNANNKTNNQAPATVYGADSPLGFPFKKVDNYNNTGKTYYLFTSTTGDQNIQITDNGTKVAYRNNQPVAANNINNSWGFFPFNKPGDHPDKGTGDDTNLDYGFAMRVDIPFTYRDGDEFYFSGDDDVWIYIDGKLALDLGGDHGAAEGTIKFNGNTATSNVKDTLKLDDIGWRDATTLWSDNHWTDWGTSFKDKAMSDVTTTAELDPSKPYHTISVFYMERGMYESNLTMSFSMTPYTQENGLTVTNKMEYGKIDEQLHDEIDKIMANDGFHYNVVDKTHGSTMFDDGKITFPGDGTITQQEKLDNEGDTSLRNSYVSVKQDSDDRFDTSYSVSDNDNTIKGSTPGTDADDGRNVDGSKPSGDTSIWVQNDPAENDDETPVHVNVDYVNKAKASGFTVEKIYNGDESASTYEFEVTYTQLFGANKETYGLSGSLAGIAYTVTDVAGNFKRTATVSSESTITIAPNEIAVFDGNIPSKTIVKVKELKAGKTFKNVEVKDSDNADENKIYTTNNGTLATIDTENVPGFIFTNGDADRRQLVYYTEINKATNLPLPADLTEQKTIVPETAAPEKINHEKSGSINLDSSVGGDSGFDTKSATISGVQKTINGSSVHTLKITSPGKGGYRITGLVVKVNSQEYYNITGFDRLYGNTNVTGYTGPKAGTNLADGLIDVEAGKTFVFTLDLSAITTDTAEVTVSMSYQGWNSSYSWPVVIDEGVTSTSGSTEPEDPYNINVYDITGYEMTHNAIDSNIATVAYANGNADTGVKNSLTFISKHVGYDKFTLTLKNNEEETTEKVDVIVYNYNVNDHVYVLDYGLPVDLMADPNGLLGGSTPYNYDKNFSVKNNDVLQNAEDADGFTVFGLTNTTNGQKYDSTVDYVEGAGDFAASMQFNQASASLKDSKLLYTPEKFMSDVDTFYIGVQVTKDDTGAGATLDATNATPVMVGKVDVMPANIVYYEDNFSQSGTSADGKNGIIYSGNVSIDGDENTDSMQSNDLDMQYGYDPTYADQAYGNSDGGAHALSSSAMAAFEFTGTGFDIMSRTNRATGVVVVNIYNKTDATNIQKDGDVLYVTNGWQNKVTSLIVDTSYENGDLYQIPVITWRNGTDVKGNYIVTITSLKGNNEAAQSIYIDGIRIYNPAQGDDTAEGEYDANNELKADILEVKQLLLGKDYVFKYDDPEVNADDIVSKISLVKYQGDGATFLSGKTVVESFNGYNGKGGAQEADPNTTKDMLTYAVSGPNNELYLNAGYGLAFEYDDEDGYKGTSKTLQIGIKNVKGSALTLQYLKDVNGKAVWTDVAEIKSATELYYRIDTLENKYEDTVYLRVTGGDGYVSVTNFKKAGYELSPVYFEPAESEDVNPALNPTDVKIKSGYNQKTGFIKNTYSTVKITTPVSVDDIKVYNVDGTEVTLSTVSSKIVNGAQEWTVKFKASKTENVAANQLYILAYDENGVKSQKMGFDGKVVQ